jgi:hypothetical protein
LRAIREDMRREALPASKVKPPGSDTMQNLATSNALGRYLGNAAAGPGIGGLIGAGYDLYHDNWPGTAAVAGAFAGAGAKRALASKDAQVLDLLANRLLNPHAVPSALKSPDSIRVVIPTRGGEVVPVTAANRLLAPPLNESSNRRD